MKDTHTIYVAGSSREIPRVRAVMTTLEGYGWKLSHDWTKDVELNGPDDGLTKEKLAPYGDNDLQAVQDADVFLLLTPTTPSTGAFTELGAALMLRKLERFSSGMLHLPGIPMRKIIISGGKPGPFWAMADVNVPDDAAACSLLAGMAGKLAGG